ncbi:MarR family winged helix-turn-helix transcriptional regulator [Nocardia veterana]|uniref:MarR family transcriptional regulator n=1 Tax=Nocardia veterana TaxID=132249 RepID=A0A7X6M3A3_9NOCA|nr:MarR family transcriptional regulator [Nocardia veterana]
MFIPYRAMEARVFGALSAAGFTDLTLAQARLVARLGPDGTRLTELAEQAQVTKQTAGALVDQLERGGYVERIPDPSDGRARLIRLAPRGARAAAVANSTAARVQDEWAAHLGPRRMEQLRAALDRLREITDPYT